MSIILDLLVSTYTNAQSLFFLNVLNQKNIYYIIFMGLVLDFIIANTYGAVTLILLFLFYTNKYISGYYLKNIFNYFFVIIALNFKFSLFSLIIQFIFIYLTRYHIIKW